MTKQGTEDLRSGLEFVAKMKAMMDDLTEFYRAIRLKTS
jgi:hypothetical protein